jgi:hypothetical protein
MRFKLMSAASELHCNHTCLFTHFSSTGEETLLTFPTIGPNYDSNQSEKNIIQKTIGIILVNFLINSHCLITEYQCLRGN